MKAISRRKFLKKVRLAVLLGAACLPLGACGGHGKWPNLAFVPPREEAFRQTKTAESAAAEVMSAEDQKKMLGELRLELGNIKDELAGQELQVAAAKSDLPGEIADYEKAIRNLSTSTDALTTAQLYLSRLTRTRDTLRRSQEKIESLERDLVGIKAKIASLQNEELAIEAGDLSQKLGALSETVVAETDAIAPYAAGELARMGLLSLEEPADLAADEGEGAPVMVWHPGQGEGAYRAALAGMLGGEGGGKTSARYLVRAVGTDKALADRNRVLIKVMTDLMDAGVALDHIALSVKGDPAVDPLEVRLYIVKPQA